MPSGTVYQSARLNEQCLVDLGLDEIVAALAGTYGYTQSIRRILLQLCDDPEVIGYRQAVLAALVENPAVIEPLVELLPRLVALDNSGYMAQAGQSSLHEVVWRVGQLENYVTCVNGLREILDAYPLQAAGWQHLTKAITALETDDVFQNLVAELPDILEKVRSIASLTIGVNLDHNLRPVEATLLAINAQKFRGPASLFATLIGQHGSEWEGLARLHTAGSHLPNAIFGGAAQGQLDDPMLTPLFRDLAAVLKQVSRPIAHMLQRYLQLNIRFLGGLGAELSFYLGAARLAQTIQASGLPVCRPELAPAETRVCEVTETYNLNLVLRLMRRNGHSDLRQAVVTNDVVFGPAGHIFILTGPNQGGKTTYVQAVGLLYVMAQAGLFVPGRRARISPVDGIYTHFPVEERPESEAGRLGEEARRLNAIFNRTTQYSLVLLNETLSSTSPGEGLYLAQDIVRILRRIGGRAIFATHLHELAASVAQLNEQTPGKGVIASLVSQAHEVDGEMHQTFRILPGPPRGISYAREIAARYGISYDQLTELLRARGVVNRD